MISGWLGLNDEPVQRASRTVLGVLGTRSNVDLEELRTHVLTPVLETWGTPELLMLPADGDSSFAIQAWAQVHDIPVQLVACDWVRHGRRAAILRDATIQRDASHLLLLQGPRSNALSTLARRLRGRGRPVALSERPGQPVDLPTKKSEPTVEANGS